MELRIGRWKQWASAMSISSARRQSNPLNSCLGMERHVINANFKHLLRATNSIGDDKSFLVWEPETWCALVRWLGNPPINEIGSMWEYIGTTRWRKKIGKHGIKKISLQVFARMTWEKSIFLEDRSKIIYQGNFKCHVRTPLEDIYCMNLKACLSSSSEAQGLMKVRGN